MGYLDYFIYFYFSYKCAVIEKQLEAISFCDLNEIVCFKNIHLKK